MKKILSIISLSLLFFSCNNKDDKGKFSVTGEIKNITDQKIYLEQLFFSEKDPEVLDTADIKAGKFSLEAIAPEQGFYRLRTEKNNVFILINDRKDISLTADVNNITFGNYSFNSAASNTLQRFVMQVDSQKNELSSLYQTLEQLKQTKGADSLYNVDSLALVKKVGTYTDYFKKFIDTTSNPVMAAYALVKSRDIDPVQLLPNVNALPKRFEGNRLIKDIVSQFGALVQQMTASKQQQPVKPKPGDMAPDITMPDPTGKLFSLSSLRGKYVLVDFWASWCGPCRGENPNVVAAFNKYKDKNFTVLGVSLDENKNSWQQAIMQDGLTWQHISDLQKWQSTVVSQYGIEGIPYNVLLDPQGKIIATELRGPDLEKKLEEVLK